MRLEKLSPAERLELLTDLINSGLIDQKEFNNLLMNTSQTSNSIPGTAQGIPVLTPGDQLEILQDKIDFTQLKKGDIVVFERYSNNGKDIVVDDPCGNYKWMLSVSNYGTGFKLRNTQVTISSVSGSVNIVASPNIISGNGYILGTPAPAQSITITGILKERYEDDYTEIPQSVINSSNCTCQTLLNGHHDECPYPKRNA